MTGFYVAHNQWGDCKICKRHQDLRAGVCFKCSDQVGGQQIGPNTYLLWEKNNLTNSWFHLQKGNDK